MNWPAAIKKVGCILTFVFLSSCAGQYKSIEEAYVTNYVECQNNKNFFSSEFIDEFDKRTVSKLIATKHRLIEGNFLKKDTRYISGPYRIQILINEKYRAYPKDISVLDMRVVSSLGKDYEAQFQELLPPISLKPEEHLYTTSNDWLNRWGWNCEVESENNMPMCQIVSYKFFPEIEFDFDFNQEESLILEIDLLDNNRRESGTVCYQAMPKLITNEGYYNIGV